MKAKCFLTVTILLLALLTSFGYAKIDPKSAVAIWTFDQGQGDVLKDSSGNGIDGKLMGGPEWVKGEIGSALEFDGKATYVDCGNNPALVPTTGQLTVTAWVFCTGSGKITIIENNSDNWGFRFAEAVPTLDGYIDMEGNDNHVEGQNVPQSEWVHLAFAWDGKTGILYQNGAKLSEAAMAVTLAQPIKSGFAIGRRGAATDSQYFTGMLDEIGVFNAALSAGDIGVIMNSGLEKAAGVEPAGKLASTWGLMKK